jgi:hypothetical protein
LQLGAAGKARHSDNLEAQIAWLPRSVARLRD